MASIPCSPTTGVIVTGGGSGIGRACALALAEAGRPIAAWDRNGPGAKETAASIAGQFGVAAVGVEVDVTDASSFDDAIATSLETIGSIGGLVHAAGIGGALPFDYLTEEAWDDVQHVNLRAQAFLAKALIPHLRAANPGSAVVGISSVEAFVGSALLPAYCSSKAGLLGLTRSLAHRLSFEGIRANAVCPGAVDTPMLAPVLENEQFRALLEAHIPMRRPADPSEVAKAVRFLLSDDASYITGTSLVVDGGMLSTLG